MAKCLKCGKNNLYRERSGGKCSGCGARFVFEPKSGDYFTDTAFQKAIEHISHKGSLSYQKRQFYYELARLRLKKLPGKVAGTIGLGVLAAIFGTIGGLVLGLEFRLKAALLPLGALYIGVWSLIILRYWLKTDVRLIRFEDSKFEAALVKWIKAKGVPQGLITKALSTAASQRAPEKDLLDYAVDRAIICDHAQIVDFLIANNFHIEQKCAILSFGGYPAEKFELLREMIRKNSNASIFVLHNASVNGCGIYRELVTRHEWFPQSPRVYDIGLHPRHAKAFVGLWQKSTPGAVVPEIKGYTPEELEWLRHYKLELTAVPPGRLLNRLRNLLNTQARGVADAYARGERDIGGSTGSDLLVGTTLDGWDDDFG